MVCLCESTEASLEQVWATCLPLVCCDLWPLLFPAGRRRSQGTCLSLSCWPPRGVIVVRTVYLPQNDSSAYVSMHVYDAHITLCVKVLPLLALQHWGGINNSATHCRTQCYTQHCFCSLSLPLDSSVFICLLLDCFYAPILFLLPPPPVRSVLPTLSLSILCHVSTPRAENLSNLLLFLAFISVYFFLFSLLFSILSYSSCFFIYMSGISFLVCLFVHSLPPSLLPSLSPLSLSF